MITSISGIYSFGITMLLIKLSPFFVFPPGLLFLICRTSPTLPHARRKKLQWTADEEEMLKV